MNASFLAGFCGISAAGSLLFFITAFRFPKRYRRFCGDARDSRIVP